MNWIKKLLSDVDRFQQQRPGLAVPVGTWKKFGDDQAGNLAALIAYYAFASIFPLLLVFDTVLNIVLKNNAALRDQLLKTAVNQYPGLHLSDVPSSGKTGLALVIGLILTFFGARGVANAVQNALNSVWEIPKSRRPGFPWSMLRSFGLIGVIGPGVVITITLSSIAGGTGDIGGAFEKIAAAVVSLVLNVGLFWLGFRLATAKEIPLRDLRMSAILAAVVWQILQLVVGYFIAHQLKSNSAYGIFGIVLGLLAWFYLQAQLTLYVAELNVVRVRRLWPRSLVPPPLTAADERAYALYAQAEQRRQEIQVEVRPTPDADIADGSPGPDPAHPDTADPGRADGSSAGENGGGVPAGVAAPSAGAAATSWPASAGPFSTGPAAPPPARHRQRRPGLREYATRAIRRFRRN